MTLEACIVHAYLKLPLDNQPWPFLARRSCQRIQLYLTGCKHAVHESELEECEVRGAVADQRAQSVEGLLNLTCSLLASR